MATSQGNEKTGSKDQLADQKLAAEERPIPSQAEGDLETVEADLKSKDKDKEKGK